MFTTENLFLTLKRINNQKTSFKLQLIRMLTSLRIIYTAKIRITIFFRVDHAKYYNKDVDMSAGDRSTLIDIADKSTIKIINTYNKILIIRPVDQIYAKRQVSAFHRILLFHSCQIIRQYFCLPKPKTPTNPLRLCNFVCGGRSPNSVFK